MGAPEARFNEFQNARQRDAIVQVIAHGRLTNSEYQELTGASRTTARRDLEALIAKGLLQRNGKGRAAHYVMSPKHFGNDVIEPRNEP